MNTILTRLGIPREIQAFFNVSADLIFSYINDYEHFGEGFHKVPTTRNIWFGGSETAANVIVTYSAMEAICFITINRLRYPRLDQLAFVAIGNRLYSEQLDWIRERFAKRRFTLAFGFHLIGHITDIKFAAGIKKISIRVYHVDDDKVIINCKDKIHEFLDGQLSLNTFKQTVGIRVPILTRKPINALTFLDQLKHDREHKLQ